MKRSAMVLFLAAGMLAGCAHNTKKNGELAHKGEDAEEKQMRCVRLTSQKKGLPDPRRPPQR